MIFAGESPLRMDRFSPKVCCSLLRLKSYALSRELLEAAFPEREVDDADFLERSVAIWLVDVEFGCGALFKKNHEITIFSKNSWNYMLKFSLKKFVKLPVTIRGWRHCGQGNTHRTWGYWCW